MTEQDKPKDLYDAAARMWEVLTYVRAASGCEQSRDAAAAVMAEVEPVLDQHSDRLREAEGILDALLFVETLDELERGKAVITEFLSRQPDRVIREG